MKKLWASVLAAFLISSAFLPASAKDLYDPNRIPIEPGQIMVQITELDTINNISLLSRVPTISRAESGLEGRAFDELYVECKNLADPACAITDPKIQGLMSQALLPSCTISSSPYCIESVEIKTGDGEFKTAKFVGDTNPKYQVAGDTKANLIEGRGPQLFELDGQLYAAIFKISQPYNVDTKTFGTNETSATVLPVRANPLGVVINSSYCIYVTDTACGVAEDYAPNTSIRTSVNFPSSIGGWFRGRMKTPNIQVKSVNSKVNRVTVEAEAIGVPRMAIPRTEAQMTGREKELYQSSSRWGSYAGLASGASASDKSAFEYIEVYRELTKDTTSGIQNAWMFNTLPASGNKCLADKTKVLGIVSTNAMAYLGTSPEFKDGYLNYKVAGMHFMPDGKTEVLGTYDLVMRSETARCLYGFTSAPVSATVSVAGGSESVATTVVSEKDGWLKMAAYGFTFSQKTIQIKLTQKSSTKKATITCVRGKVIKKVTAVAPKCPTGYKKK
jgi:hypothetical protein